MVDAAAARLPLSIPPSTRSTSESLDCAMTGRRHFSRKRAPVAVRPIVVVVVVVVIVVVFVVVVVVVVVVVIVVVIIVVVSK